MSFIKYLGENIWISIAVLFGIFFFFLPVGRLLSIPPEFQSDVTDLQYLSAMCLCISVPVNACWILTARGAGVSTGCQLKTKLTISLNLLSFSFGVEFFVSPMRKAFDLDISDLSSPFRIVVVFFLVSFPPAPSLSRMIPLFYFHCVKRKKRRWQALNRDINDSLDLILIFGPCCALCYFILAQITPENKAIKITFL